MFVLSQSTSYTWPVTVEFPADGGRTEKQTFDAEFKRLSQTRVKELADAIQSGELTDADVATEVMLGWSGVTDGSDEVPFSQAALKQLLDLPLVASSIVVAYFGSLSGAKRKN
jgi:hypothetical protein